MRGFPRALFTRIVAASCPCVIAPSAHALSCVAFTPEQLVARADHVILGKVQCIPAA